MGQQKVGSQVPRMNYKLWTKIAYILSLIVFGIPQQYLVELRSRPFASVETNPYTSFLGKAEVALYISNVNS